MDLVFRPALDREDLVVTNSNSHAVSWIDKWPDWPSHAIGIYGPSGSGKSHLVSIFAKKTNAKILQMKDFSEFEPISLSEKFNCIVLDHCDSYMKEEELLHLFNSVRDCSGFLILASRIAPSRWKVKLDDLSSRLSGMPVVEVLRPDDQSMTVVLSKLFRDRQISISEEIITYAANRIPRTFRALEQLVVAVDRESIARGRGITIPLIREIINSSLFNDMDKN